MRARAPAREHSAHIKFVGRGDWWKLIGAAGFMFSSLWALQDKLAAHRAFEAVLQAQEEINAADVRELRTRLDNCK